MNDRIKNCCSEWCHFFRLDILSVVQAVTGMTGYFKNFRRREKKKLNMDPTVPLLRDDGSGSLVYNGTCCNPHEYWP